MKEFFCFQIGWQESISRLLIKKQITNSYTKNDHILGKDIQNIPFEENPEFLNQMDLMTFDEKTMELNPHEGSKEQHLTLTELQASVTEAANVIEHEIKGDDCIEINRRNKLIVRSLEMAESVTGKVAGNISSVYSIIRQKTHDIHDTFESLAMGNDHPKMVSQNNDSPTPPMDLQCFYPMTTYRSHSHQCQLNHRTLRLKKMFPSNQIFNKKR